MDHAELIRQRGGIRPLARALGHKHHTTVQGWLERNRIPAEHLPSVERVTPPTDAQTERAGDGKVAA